MRPTLVLLLAACNGPAHDTSTPVDTDTDTDTDADADTDTDSDSDSDSDTDTDTDTDTAPAFANYTLPTFQIHMVAIPAAGTTYSMGAGVADPEDAFQDHDVTFTRDLWIADAEVTEVQWAAWATAPDPSPSSSDLGDNFPVEFVSWEDVARYANALSSAEGLEACYAEDGTEMVAAYAGDPGACGGYRLATEAEWEYCARAGQDLAYAGSDVADDVAWYGANAGGAKHEARGKVANAWGLYDMSGNVWEWTGDWYESAYAPEAVEDPAGPTSGPGRVIRGGSWFEAPENVRVAFRYFVDPTFDDDNVGFRIARSRPAE